MRWFAAAVLAFAVLATGTATSAGQREVEERLACQCGCGLTVHTCNHLQCSFAVPVREDIAKSLAAVKALGAEIVEVDKKSFQAVMGPVYDKFMTTADMKRLVKTIQPNSESRPIAESTCSQDT